MKKFLIVFAAFTIGFVGCKGTKTYNGSIQEEFKKHISFLASDDLEGRMSGTEGELQAVMYIEGEFKKIGLSPGGSDGDFRQSFEFISGKEVAIDNGFSINGTVQTLNDDYYPLALSANGSVKGRTMDVGYGIEAPDLDHNDYKTEIANNRIFVIEISSPDGLHPHSKYVEHNSLEKKVEKAVQHGAAGVIFVNSDEKADDPELDLKNKIHPMSIPVIFSKNQVRSGIQAEIQVDIETQNAIGQNVLAYIDNQADQTIVIGAHHDHLGHGAVSGSLYRGEPAIHNGADDNASGVAMVIELAKVVKAKQYRNNNFLFMTFSGEELGLYGSNYFVKEPSVDLSKVNAMFNFDMVGRLEDNKLKVMGVGTSPVWAEVIENLKENTIEINTSESGIGPSDQTSFYLKDIPVLQFFTGAHEDYHKPTDDEEFINYDGLKQIKSLVIEVLDELEEQPKLAFTKTTDDNADQAPKFKVTLGVVPDYLYEERGMRIEGVTDGKTASVAGIQPGDIVIKMGDHEVKDMMGYMQALSYFEKGDSTDVVVQRGEDEVLHQVVFQ